MQVSVADAKNKLPELIKAVEEGEPVTICRRGVPVVDIVRTEETNQKERSLGTLKRQNQNHRSGLVEANDGREVEDVLGGAM